MIKEDTIIGAVSCYGNEIDDLIVKNDEQGKGYGKELLLWGIHHIRKQNALPIILHVAKWNEKAIGLYRQLGFVIHKEIKVR